MSTSDQAPVPAEIPWQEPLLRFTDRVQELVTMVHLFRAGCHDLQMSAKLFDVLADDDDKVARAKKKSEVAELAKDQRARGYPLLYEHTLISIWGALEAMVEDLAVAWLHTHPEQLQAQPVSDVKLTVGDYERLSPEERLRHIIFEVQRGAKADLKRGVGQFNALLSAVGINWTPPGPVRDALFYHHQLRNLFAHRGGIVDRRFAEICPTLGFDLGDTVVVTDRVVNHLSLTAGVYVVGLRNHCAATDGYKLAKVDLALDPGFDWAKMRSMPAS